MDGDNFRSVPGRTARFLAHEAETVRFIRMAARMADDPDAVSSIRSNAIALLGLIEGNENGRKI